MQPSLLPVFHLDTAPLPQAEQFPAWAATMMAFDVSQPLPGGSFLATGSAWQVGSLVVSEQSLGLATFARSAAKIRADGADHYSIIFVLDGAWDGQLGRRTEKPAAAIYASSISASRSASPGRRTASPC